MYIKVILPIAVDTLYSYSVSKECEESICIGGRVAVELGKRKIYSGIVSEIHNTEPTRELKEISHILDFEPIVSKEQIEIWRWISNYYMCSLGEVMRRFFPASMRVDTYSDIINSGFNFQTKYSLINREFLSLPHSTTLSHDTLNSAIESLSRAPKLREAFLAICEALEVRQEGEKLLFNSKIEREKVEIKRERIRELLKRELLESKTEEIKIDYSSPKELISIVQPTLSMAQKECNKILSKEIEKSRCALLFGVAGAGKTEIYVTQIIETLQRGENVLLLLPELALSSQLVRRLKDFFGDLMLIYNSHQSPLQRHHTYNKILYSGGGDLIISTSIGIGLPFQSLGLVVVDEEQAESYKSYVSAPRYNARDAAVVLSSIHGARCILVSATPSLESFHNVKSGKYGVATINERYNQSKEPKVKIIERRLIATAEKRERGCTSDTRFFSNYLLQRIEETLAKGEQVILFQNRRGYSSSVECKSCGEIPKCPDCNVALTYHSTRERLLCHYCSYSIPLKCPNCGGEDFLFWGVGTQNIEQKILNHFPQSRTVRIDGDSVKSAKWLSATLSAIERREIDIIVATNIISKGFDFKGVSLVGVINCDSMLSYGDFRASERVYATLSQLAGRTARSESVGEIIIQTNTSGESVVEDIRNGTYESMYEREVLEREQFLYPPFSRIIEVTLLHSSADYLDQVAKDLAEKLRAIFGFRLLGPTPPLVEKRQDNFLRTIIIKLENGSPLKRAKELLAAELKVVKSRRVMVSVNVDC